MISFLSRPRGWELLELPITPCDIDESVVRSAAKRRLLEGAQPRPDGKSHGLHLVAPHVDVSPLFERESEHGHTVINVRCANLKARLLQQKAPIALPSFTLGARETGAPGKRRRRVAAKLVDLRHAEDQVALIALDEVPSIRSEFVFDRVDKPGGPVD